MQFLESHTDQILLIQITGTSCTYTAFLQHATCKTYMYILVHVQTSLLHNAVLYMSRLLDAQCKYIHVQAACMLHNAIAMHNDTCLDCFAVEHVECIAIHVQTTLLHNAVIQQYMCRLFCCTLHCYTCLDCFDAQICIAIHRYIMLDCFGAQCNAIQVLDYFAALHSYQ